MSTNSWTLFAILAGTELGVDAPRVAVHLHVLAEIFLRLVRVIVAPLIFGTLTIGIAGPGQLRSLGRGLLLSTAAVMMILGVDALIDMGRIALNVAGNCLASAVVSRWETSESN
jgi:proton glutamate symport protein